MSLPATTRVLLTGTSGTLGYNVMRLLAKETNHKVLAPVRAVRPFLSPFASRVDFQKLDLVDIAATKHYLSHTRPDVIVHCAASGLRPPKASWFEIISFNVETTLRLFETYCASGVRHFVYISTGLVYREQGRPLRETDPVENLHPYGASKAAADLLLQAAAVEFGRTLTIVRPFAFTGIQDAGTRLFPQLITAASSGKPFCMTTGKQVRDFCAVEDIARAVLLCIERQPQQAIEKFNVGSGMERTVRQLVETVCSALGLKVDLQFGAVPDRAYEPRHLVADITRARQELGWSPQTSLSYAVWELAREMAPALPVREPERKVWAKAAN